MSNLTFDQFLATKFDYELFAKKFLKIRDGKNKYGGGITPFVFNRAQKRIWEIVKDRIQKKLPVRLYFLKARQMGISTWTEGLGYWRMSFNPHTHGLVVAHETSSAQKILKMLKLMWKEMPEEVRPLRHINNRNELSLANPRYPDDGSNNPGLESVISIATADNSNFGIGDTIQFAHLSEFARYPEINSDIQHTLGTFYQAIPDTAGTFVIYETTARGFNYAKEVWDNPNNGILKIFLSWLADEDYTLDQPLDKNKLFDYDDSAYGDEKFLQGKIIEQLKFWYPEHENNPAWLEYESLKRLNWRRHKIDSPGIEGNIDLFRQEYPTYPEEAFITTGRNVFSTKKLSDLREFAESEDNLKDLVTFRFDKARKGFIESKRIDELRIFQYPQPKNRYVIGADVGEGYEDSDFSTAHVLKLPYNEQVAVAQLRIDPDDFADFLETLGKIYNKAFIAVEITGSGLTTNLKLEKSLKYPRLYRRTTFDSNKKKFQDKFGWSTNRATKDIMINDLRGAVRDDLVLIRDPKTIIEMLHYTINDLGKTSAIEGHDDLVTGLAIAYQMYRQVPNREAPTEVVEGPPVGSLKYYERILDNSILMNGDHLLGYRNFGDVKGI